MMLWIYILGLISMLVSLFFYADRKSISIGLINIIGALAISFIWPLTLLMIIVACVLKFTDELVEK